MAKAQSNSPIVSGVEFRDVVGFPGYCVGDDGSVWSCWYRGPRPAMTDTWGPLAQSPYRRGYMKVTLRRGGKNHYPCVHRLVLEAFVGPCPPGMQACHFPDPDPGNNRLGNLRWDTVKANCADRRAHRTDPSGSRNRAAKLDEETVVAIKRALASGIMGRALARAYGVSDWTISAIKLGKCWQHIA